MTRTLFLPPDSGKIDKKALTALAGELEVAEQSDKQASTATERWLAAAWAEVLGIPAEQIGRQDHFFDLGGTSLSALKLAIALNRLVTLKDLVAQPILANQAELIERRLEQAGGVPAAPAPIPNGGCAAARATAPRGEGRR